MYCLLGYDATRKDVVNDYSKTLEVLIKLRADVNIRDSQGRTALMIAAARWPVKDVKRLIKSGADINARDNQGCSTLSIAQSEKRQDVIRLLRSIGLGEN
jgi:hypothetical protein